MRPGVLVVGLLGVVAGVTGIALIARAGTSRLPIPHPAHALIYFGNAMLFIAMALNARRGTGLRVLFAIGIVFSALVGALNLVMAWVR